MSIKQDNILITGGNGLLGQELRVLLERCNFNIIATGIGVDRLLSHSHTYLELDISSSTRCQYILNKYNPSVIINTAACTNVDQCETQKNYCLAINSNSLHNFLPYVKKNQTHFIHISTDFVFDGLLGNYKENDTCNPLNFYGFSKLEAEKTLMYQCLTSTIIRTSLIYGLTGSNFLTWVKNKLEHDVELNIVGDQYRTPTYVFDISLVILRMIELKKYGLYHISSGERLSVFNIVCNIAECLKQDVSKINRIKSAELNQVARRPLDSTLNIEKAMKHFDFSPTKLNNALNNIL
tara:strand:+ start:568 stop:1449 length:882 start_codon:yes stop_codon:yes gene_type:complete